MLGLILRILAIVLLVRIAVRLVRAFLPPPAARRAPSDPPPREPARPPLGNVVDAEFEDLDEER